jgi:hypothetical protein
MHRGLKAKEASYDLNDMSTSHTHKVDHEARKGRGRAVADKCKSNAQGFKDDGTTLIAVAAAM